MADRDVTELSQALQLGQKTAGNYTEIEPDGTSVAKGEATCWDDLRVSVNATEVNGSNPPVDALFKNDGNEVPGTAYALSFLSTSQGNLNLPDVPEFDTSSDFSFEFWIRPVVGTQNNIECVRKQGVFELDFAGSDQFNLNVIGAGSSTGPLQFSRGSWNHVIILFDTVENEVRMYLNGQLNITINAVSVIDNTNIFQFNRLETLYDVDYIAYWSETLNSSEISLRYSSGAGKQLLGNEVGLKGLWEMNDGAGSTAIEKTGIALDGEISGGSEGVQWDWIGGHVGNTTPGSRGVILKYFSPDNLNELYFSVQLPHEWLEGSNIRPHIHWVPNNNGAVSERVKWSLEYTWCDIGELFGDTSVLTANDNIYSEDLIKDKHYITNLGEIVGAGKKLSSMIICRVFRDAEDAGDTFNDFAALLEIDFHYQINMLGSREEFVK